MNFTHEQTSRVQPGLTIFGDKRLHSREGQSTSSLYPFSDVGWLSEMQIGWRSPALTKPNT